MNYRSLTARFVAPIVLSLYALNGVLLGVEKPNVVILYSDDAGYADFGFQPNCVQEMKALTPNIDTIAADGATFSNAYMSGAVCSPSRAGLMTGRYQQRFGYDNNLPPGTKNGLDLKEVFAAKRLGKLGYKTGLIGKWHLGYPPKFHPNERGFDWFYGLLQGSRTYYPYENPSANRVIQENGKPTAEGGYVTDRFGDAAVRFINENKEQPFFLFVSFTAPHSPNQPKTEDLPRVAHMKGGRSKYAGLIVSLDDNVGKVLKALKDNGLDESTIVIFTNDNGGQTVTGAVNTPLKGKKGQLTEGGIRVPWAMRWPGKIKSGSTIDQPVIALDILPTLVEAAGSEVREEWKLDGRSMLPLFEGETLPARTLYWRKGGSGGSVAVREGKWKYLHRYRIEENKVLELYDLDKDVSESTNLAMEHPDIVEKLKAKAVAWESELIEPLWGNGGKKPSAKNKINENGELIKPTRQRKKRKK